MATPASTKNNPLEITIESMYFDHISSGTKTVEGRIYKHRYRTIQVGAHIRFVSRKDSSLSLICEVAFCHLYSTFRELLQKEKIENCLPNVASLDEAEKIYYSFEGYAKEEKEFGVVAIGIRLLKQQ